MQHNRKYKLFTNFYLCHSVRNNFVTYYFIFIFFSGVKITTHKFSRKYHFENLHEKRRFSELCLSLYTALQLNWVNKFWTYLVRGDIMTLSWDGFSLHFSITLNSEVAALTKTQNYDFSQNRIWWFLWTST